MSKFDANKDVEVLNYNQHEVYVSTAKENYKFNASKDGKTPAYLPLTMAEIKWICNNTNIFQCGILTFEDDIKKEVFEELRIHDWENILTNEQIEDILLNPTKEKLNRIFEIDNATYFDRVRTICFILVQKEENVTTKVRELIDIRTRELQRNIRKTGIELVKPINKEAVNNEKLSALEQQNASLQEQLDEMKAMMKKLAATKQIGGKKAEPKQDDAE